MNSHVHPLFASALNSVFSAAMEGGKHGHAITQPPAPKNNGAGVPSTKLTLAEPGSPAADYLTRYYDRADRLGINTGD